eukprot:scaffold78991_cov48-Attheya_sp.AAC.2
MAWIDGEFWIVCVWAHHPDVLMFWQANVDCQLVLDIGKVTLYMAKYVTKTEADCSKSMASIMKRIMVQAAAEGKNVQFVLRKAMARLIGQRIKSQQEVSHLILNLPLVSCTHTFVRISLRNDTRKLIVEPPAEVAAEDAPPVDANRKKKPVTKISLIDAYAVRLEVSAWLSAESYESYKDGLEEMSLFEFASVFTVGEREHRRNKISPRAKDNVVAVFMPKKSSNPAGKNYPEYCKFALAKFRPWSGDYENAWDSLDVELKEDHELLASLWEDFIVQLREAGKEVPDALRQEIDWFARNRRELESEGDFVNTEPANVDDSDDSDADSIQLDGIKACEVTFAENSEFDDEDEMAVEWSKDHDFSILDNDYGENDPSVEELSAMYKNDLLGSADFTRQDRPIISEEDMSQFNEEQVLAHDTIVRAALQEPDVTAQNGGISKLIILIGVGGTGKSTTINGVITTLKLNENWDEDNYAVFATTGLAATNVHGCMVHSWQEGLGFPIEHKPYSELKGQTLKRMQAKFKDKLRLVILDEYSMLRQKELFYMDQRLRQIMCSPEPFGGVTIVLAGDPGQLPPVKGNALWNPAAGNVGAGKHDYAGYGLYQYFETVVKLKKNVRIDPNDRDAVAFNDFQMRLHDGLNSRDDFHTVRKTCSRHSMGEGEWERRGFDDPNTPHLFCTNKEVQMHNAKCIKKLGTPIAFIRAEHTGKGASATKDTAKGLVASMYLAVGAKVLVTTNVAQRAGICNGSFGIVKEIVYEEGAGPPALPKFVLVDLGAMYTGPSFFPLNREQSGWVPIHPVENSWTTPDPQHNFVDHSRKMLPLTTAWAFTIWKAQGQTFLEQVVLNLGKNEKEHGLAYVAFSHAIRFANIGLVQGITFDRLVRCVREQSKMACRLIHENALNDLYELTKVAMAGYTYTPSNL